MKFAIFASLILLVGCAANPPHARMVAPQALGPAVWQCNLQNECTLVRPWKPSQLTPLGCWIHTMVTWKKVMECKKEKG